MILPTVLSVERPAEQEVLLTLAVSGKHPAFAGHFPGQPVLPGVVQTDWAIQFAAIYLATGTDAAAEFRVKFTRIIQPDTQINLHLKLDPAARNFSFEYRHQGDVAATGRINLEARA